MLIAICRFNDFAVGAVAGGIGDGAVHGVNAIGSAYHDAKTGANANLSRLGEDVTQAVRTGGPQAFGEQGQKTILSFYDGTSDLTEYYGSFAVWYQAGMTGLEKGKVKDRYSWAMNQAQREAAWLAGQVDAQASLEAEKRKAPFVPVYSDEHGLVESLSGRRLDANEARVLNQVARDLKMQILVSDSLERGADGFLRNGRMELSRDAKAPLLSVGSHEVAHRIQELAPKAFRVYQDYSIRKISEINGYDAVHEIQYRYAKSGVNLSTEQAMNEVTAEFTQKMFEDGKLFQEFAGQHRSVARKILDALKRFIRKVRNVFSRAQVEQDSEAMRVYGVDMETLEQAAKLWQAAYDAAAEQAQKNLQAQQGQKNTAQEGGKKRYSIVRTEDGKAYVKADRPLFFGRDRGNWPDKIYNYILDNILGPNKSVIIHTDDGADITLNTTTAAKAGFEYWPKNGRRMTYDEYELKLNAEAHIDELLQVSKAISWSPDVGQRHGDLAAHGWQYRIAFFQYDGIYYKVYISIALGKDNRNVAYNIGQIEDRKNSPNINGSSAKSGAQREGRASSDGSVTQPAAEVNPQILEATEAAEAEELSDSGTVYSLGRTNPYAGRDLSADPEIYSYDFLTALPDMTVTVLPEVSSLQGPDGKISTAAVVKAGMKNAYAIGTVRAGKVFVPNSYTYRPIMVTTNSIRHGLNGGFSRLLTNSKLVAVIGDVIKNAVPINALQNKAKGVSGTYAMAGYAKDSQGREFIAIITVEQYGDVSGIEVYDVTHAVSGRQKNSSRADTKSQGFYPSTTAKVSIADFLKNVKQTHQSILSKDVLTRLGETRNPDGFYTGQAKFSLARDGEGTGGMRLDNKTHDRLLHIVQRLKNKRLPTVNPTLLRQYLGELDSAAKFLTGQSIQNLNRLHRWYQERIANDADFISDKRIEEGIERLKQRDIFDLSIQEAIQLTEVLLHIQNQLIAAKTSRDTPFGERKERGSQASATGTAKEATDLTLTTKKGTIELLSSEQYAVSAYVSSESYKINSLLRKGIPLSKEQQAMVDALDSALEKLPIYQGTVYRSMDGSMMDLEAFREAYAVGKKVTCSAYTSVSVSVYDGSMDIQIVMQSRTARDLREFNPDEEEILFPRNVTFQVVKIENDTIFMEEV